MMADSPEDLEVQVSEWREFVAGREAITPADVDELEGHLRDQIAELRGSGLADDEAFLIAVKRMGRLDDISREFALEHSDRLWKQLVVDDAPATGVRGRGLGLTLALAFGAAIAIKLPALFGVTLDDDIEFYARNMSVLVLPFLAAFFLIRRHARVDTIAWVAAPFVLAAVLLNVYPFVSGGMTEPLAAVHAVVALWLVTGIAYVGGDWRSNRARMDFIRFTGEWFVYFVLIALGGAVLAVVTIGVFSAIGLDATWFVEDWLIPCGAAGAVVIAAWLVEAKQNVIENIAPVLTRLFTPLFTVLLLALIVAGLLQGDLVNAVGDGFALFGLDASRDLLIIFDLVLIVVLALLLYSMSARDPIARPSWFDWLQLVMIASAVVVDILVLIAMIGRIGAYGVSANKLASLGLNVILLVCLAGAAYLLVRFLRGRATYAALERWQTSYLPVYLAWAAVVVIVFPPVFGYV